MNNKYGKIGVRHHAGHRKCYDFFSLLLLRQHCIHKRTRHDSTTWQNDGIVINRATFPYNIDNNNDDDDERSRLALASRKIYSGINTPFAILRQRSLTLLRNDRRLAD